MVAVISSGMAGFQRMLRPYFGRVWKIGFGRVCLGRALGGGTGMGFPGRPVLAFG